jgi:hypothetical protein
MRSSNRIKRVLIISLVFSLILIAGCSQVSDLTGDITSKSSGENLEITREAKLGTEWQVKQMEIELAADDELSILMKLDSGDTVDGYFYLEKGEDVDFNISGNSLIHKSEAPSDDESEGVTSDRFSFVASKSQGDTYTLTFLNNASDSQDKIKVFLEVIYPDTASLFIPLVNK